MMMKLFGGVKISYHLEFSFRGGRYIFSSKERAHLFEFWNTKETVNTHTEGRGHIRRASRETGPQDTGLSQQWARPAGLLKSTKHLASTPARRQLLSSHPQTGHWKPRMWTDFNQLGGTAYELNNNSY